ncbi:MAG TPA: hypothetical protein VEW05_29265 [Candidatus Polarisedimenticolia bacterium]|nr:hypothetical protein [Candidatus Polarisedimenticolia bacterium]
MNTEEKAALANSYWLAHRTWLLFIYDRAIVSILTLALSAAMAFGREARVDSPGPLALDVPVAPALVRVGNVPRLVDELRIRNNATLTVHLSQLEVVTANPKSERIATIKGSELCADIGHPERNPPPQESCDIAAGHWAIAYLWLPIMPEAIAPQRFLHRLIIEFPGSSGPNVATIMGAPFQLDGHDPVVLRPPEGRTVGGSL